jgi:hypothetical protein
MMPEEITTLFATAATLFQPIAGQLTNDNLMALCDVLYPLLLDIPFDMDGTHNLIGLIKPMPLYTMTWGMAFPIPLQPPAYPAIADDASAVVRAQCKPNMPSLSWITPPTMLPNGPQPNIVS